MQVEVRACRAGREAAIDSLGGAQQGVGAVGVGQVALDVAGHRREVGTGGGQGGEVLAGPVPDLDGEAEVVDAARRAPRTGRSRKTISAQTASVKPYAAHGSTSVERDRARRSRRTRCRPARRASARAGVLAGDGGRRGPRGRRRRTRRTRRCRRRGTARRRRAPSSTCRPAAVGVHAASVRGAVAHGHHARRAEHLAADVVPVGGGEARLGDGDGAVVEGDDDDRGVEQARRP